MNAAIVIQARMSSKRLRGKVLKQVQGKPLLTYLVERIQRTCEEEIIVATSDHSSDDLLADFCNESHIPCYRGELENVAKRFLDLMKQLDLKAVCRISGDSPLLDPQLIQRAWDLFHSGSFDVVTNVHPRSYPSGQSVEIFSCQALTKAYKLMKNTGHYEHVTSLFYELPGQFKISNFRTDKEYKDFKFSVDTEDDFIFFEKLIFAMNQSHTDYSLDDLCALVREMN